MSFKGGCVAFYCTGGIFVVTCLNLIYRSKDGCLCGA